MVGEDEVKKLILASGLADVPLALSIRTRDRSLDWVQGSWTGDQPVKISDRFYAASLAKQVTAAAVAVLALRGLLDVDAPVGDFLPDLPAWRSRVSAKHLLHHLGGLPEIDARPAPGHWTSAKAFDLLRRSPDLSGAPGTTYRYSNAGYICLAAIVEQVSGMPYAKFVREALFDPLQLTDIDFIRDAPPAFPQVAGMGDALPLSVGDGGIWTSAVTFAAWLDHQNRDTLGIAALVEQPGTLADGPLTDYGWGIGLRRLNDHALFFHGGGWPGAHSKAIRCPALGLSVVALAATDTDDGVVALVDAVTRLAAA